MFSVLLLLVIVIAYHMAAGMYHLCDLEIYCPAGLSYTTLQDLDFMFSFLSMCTIAVYLVSIFLNTIAIRITYSYKQNMHSMLAAMCNTD
jgi:succinate dehydrogenase/fumarate reductase cytochrome b subunit